MKNLCIVFITLVFACTLSPDLEPYRNKSGVNTTGTSVWQTAVSSAPFGTRYGHSSVSFNGSIWIVGGVTSTFKNDVWYSPDGSSWYCATTNAGFSPRYAFALAVFSNSIWLVGGNDGSASVFTSDVWRSVDGTNWTLVTADGGFAGRRSHTLLAFNGNLWLIAGRNTNGYSLKDVLYSGNGSNWTQATTNAFTNEKSGHSSLVFNNRMWVFGSVYNIGGNEVWSTLDGTNWTPAIAPYESRCNGGAVVYNGKIWLVAGYLPAYSRGTNDVWSSTDGVNWKLETAAATFDSRYFFSLVTHNNSIQLIAGNTSGTACDDVWYYR